MKTTWSFGKVRVVVLALLLFAGGVGASAFGPMLMREVGLASVAAQDASTPVATDASGTAVVKLRAGTKLPKGKLVLTITVTKPGDASLSATKRVAVGVRSK